MKRHVFSILLLLFLVGCAPANTQAASAEAPYRIVFAIPMDASLETFYSDWALQRYSHNNGDYEITTQVLENTSAAACIATLTGRPVEHQAVIQTERFGMPQYQFAWYDSQSDRLCRAAILEDEHYCYQLIFATDAEKQADYTACIHSVISSLGLSGEVY